MTCRQLPIILRPASVGVARAGEGDDKKVEESGARDRCGGVGRGGGVPFLTGSGSPHNVARSMVNC